MNLTRKQFSPEPGSVKSNVLSVIETILVFRPLRRALKGRALPARLCYSSAMNTVKIVRIPRLSMGGAMLLLAALFAASCSEAADPKDREKELSYLRCVVPESLLEFAHVEVSAIENITIVGERAGQDLGLHLLPGQKKKNSGIRAEISVNYPFQSGDTARYAWRFNP